MSNFHFIVAKKVEDLNYIFVGSIISIGRRHEKNIFASRRNAAGWYRVYYGM